MRNLFDDPAAAGMRKEAEEMIRSRPGGVLKERLPIVGMA